MIPSPSESNFEDIRFTLKNQLYHSSCSILLLKKLHTIHHRIQGLIFPTMALDVEY